MDIHIHFPDLVTAASALANALAARVGTAHTPAQAPAAPVAQTAPAPAAAPAPVVAPTTAPSYTGQDLAMAGAQLLRDNPGVQPQLMGLLTQFGVRAATELKQDQLSAFAAAMRQLGAKL